MDGNWASGDWNIAHNPDAWELMFNELPDDNLGLEWEPCHQLVYLIDPIPQIRKWAPQIFHVHGKDATVRWDVIREHGIFGKLPFVQMRTPGFGDSDWTRVISELRLAGYRGAIDIEGWHDPVYRDDLEITGQVRALELSEAMPRRGDLSAEPGVTASGGRSRAGNIGGQPGKRIGKPSLTREQREEVHEHHMRRTLLRSALVAAATALCCRHRHACRRRRCDDKWCKDVHIRFFVGGAEGDAFGTIVYNGAKQAEADLGAKVDYIFSGWDSEKMVQQLREAVAVKPDGIAMMGHPGDAAIMPLAEQAHKDGIKMMYQNVPVPKVVAAFGGGYVGAQQEPQGRALGAEAFRLAGLKAGDKAIMIGPFENESRGARERGTVAALEGGRRRRRPDQLAEPEWAADPNLAIPVITAALLNNPDVKAVGYPGGQMLGNVPTYMQAAGKKPGDIFNFGFDTSPQIVEGFKGGWVQLTADQQPFLQGYLPILSLCQQVVLRPGADERRHRRRLRHAARTTRSSRSSPSRRCADPAADRAGRAGPGRPHRASEDAMAERLIELRDITKSYGQRLCAGRRQSQRRPRRGGRPDRRQRRRQVDADQDPRRRRQADQRRDPRPRQAGDRMERGALARRRHRDGVPGPRAGRAADHRAQHLHGPRADRPASAG